MTRIGIFPAVYFPFNYLMLSLSTFYTSFFFKKSFIIMLTVIAYETIIKTVF
jgi:hypothetical protein